MATSAPSKPQEPDLFHMGQSTLKWEAYMHYLFGVSEEGWWGAVDLSSGQAHLFMPRLPEAYAVWMGPLKSCQDYRLNGRFSQQQQLVYNAVLDAHSAVLAAMRPGVSWPDMHTLANRRILEALLAGGLVRGEVDALLAADIGALFMPHGLGHLLGLDTHDVGGYLPGQPPRIDRPGYRSLRTARKDPSKSQFLEEATLLPFMAFGGVRIEDNVLVTATGAESLTHVPRTVGEIEAVMAGGPWPA
ncbi:hypothetical protein QJQ45_002076 [Haematococcus lacustris]|nr:hypothetical protein QJQ45_002076 [Haematococcus lacustris]